MDAAVKTKTDDSTAEDAAALSAELAKLREDLAGLVESVGRIGRERADALVGSEKISESLAAGEAALADFATELRNIERDITASTRRSPWRALGIAIGLGLVVGFFLRR